MQQTYVPGRPYSVDSQRIQVETVVTAPEDAFSRLRVSNPAYRFDSQLTNGISSDLWDTAWSGNGTVTFDHTNRMAALSISSSGTTIMQSHYHSPYTPGRSQLAFITFLFGSAPASGASRRVGYFDGYDGIYLEQTSTGVNLVLASSTSNGVQTIPQASWNIDPLLDGTGPSGLTLDLTKTQILVISLQALYTGCVTVGFDIKGSIFPVHQFNHANTASYPYIGQASLPVHYEVRTSGSATTMNAICSSVMSEGGEELSHIPGRTFAASNGATTISVTTRRPVLSIRPLHLFNLNRNNAAIIPISLAARTNTVDIFVELVRNGTLSGSSFSSVDAANSVVEFDVAGTTITGGSTLFSTYEIGGAGMTTVISANLISKLVAAYSHLLATPDVLSVVCTSLGAAAPVSAALTWKEVR